LAAYYTAAGRGGRARLAKAHAEMSEGYQLCLSAQYAEALERFNQAETLFASAGDVYESHLSDYWIAYCLSQVDRLKESVTLLESLAEFSRQRGYRWLLSQALCWLANCQDLLGDHSRSIALDRQALEIAGSIGDTYNEQKILTQIALQYTQLGRPGHALQYHQRTLALAADAPPSPRQDWRNLTYTAQTFFSLGRYEAAAAYESEALRLCLGELNDPMLTHLSLTHLGMILAGLGRYAEAEGRVEESLCVARSVGPDPGGKKMVAYSLLQLGNLSRQAGDCRAALSRYDQALALYNGMEFDLDRYETRKGRLLCYLKGGDDSATREELARVLDLFEGNRALISEEQNRNSFFDAEQDVYDIAIGYAHSRGDYELAYAYSERARARSLLDLLRHGATGGAGGAEPDVNLAAAAAPLDPGAVRGRLPHSLQVVQYALLKDRLLIWVVSDTKFTVVERAIPASEVSAKSADERSHAPS
jgi:tetratricopeptide (TPR) repeat protein